MDTKNGTTEGVSQKENMKTVMDIARDLAPEIDMIASYAEAQEAEDVFHRFDEALRAGNIELAARYLTALEMRAGPETANEAEYDTNFRSAVSMVREALLGWDKEPIE